MPLKHLQELRKEYHCREPAVAKCHLPAKPTDKVGIAASSVVGGEEGGASGWAGYSQRGKHQASSAKAPNSLAGK